MPQRTRIPALSSARAAGNFGHIARARQRRPGARHGHAAERQPRLLCLASVLVGVWRTPAQGEYRHIEATSRYGFEILVEKRYFVLDGLTRYFGRLLPESEGFPDALAIFDVQEGERSGLEAAEAYQDGDLFPRARRRRGLWQSPREDEAPLIAGLISRYHALFTRRIRFMVRDCTRHDKHYCNPEATRPILQGPETSSVTALTIVYYGLSGLRDQPEPEAFKTALEGATAKSTILSVPFWVP
uniref:Uncharacterized protein n=1 Tax=Mycena chlorophos TaxID=658473 RepID=A0ABQ0L432_MYCCL|nr:predicted protein [Mycena chlorophos]